jgi:hypothetical protein
MELYNFRLAVNKTYFPDVILKIILDYQEDFLDRNIEISAFKQNPSKVYFYPEIFLNPDVEIYMRQPLYVAALASPKRIPKRKRSQLTRAYFNNFIEDHICDEYLFAKLSCLIKTIQKFYKGSPTFTIKIEKTPYIIPVQFFYDYCIALYRRLSSDKVGGEDLGR